MASYYETKKSFQLTGGHICSKCKSVILTVFEFYATAKSSVSMRKAQEGADLAVERGLTALSSFKEKPFSVTRISERQIVALHTGFGMTNLDHSCPYCGHRERWQKDPFLCDVDPVSGISLVKNVPEESRLTVLTNKEALNAWQIKVMDTNVVKIKQYWEENPAEAEKIRGQIQELKKQIETLNAEKATIWEKSQCLKGKVEKKTAEMKGFSLFSAARKTAKAELEELNKQYSAQKTADSEREKSIIRTISGLETQLKELKYSNPGVFGEMESVTPKDAPYCQAISFS